MKKNLKNQNIFLGPNAVLEYLNPAKHAPASIVELPQEFILAQGPFVKRDKVRIILKMASEWPTSSIKLAAVEHWFRRQKKLGKLTKKTVVVIPSSGNAAIACVVVGRRYGVRVIVIMPKDAPELKKLIVEIANRTRVIDSLEVPGKTAVEIANRMGKRPHHIVFRQYEDELNVQGHKLVTMTQIWQQMQAAGVQISGIAVATGTAGTGNAAYEFTKSRKPKAIAVRIICAEKNPLPGMRPLSRLGPDQVPLFQKHKFLSGEVEQYEGYRLTVRLLSDVGLNVGITTGGLLGGAFNVLGDMKKKDPKMWKRIQNNKGERVFVLTNGDLLQLYLQKLSTVLDAKDM